MALGRKELTCEVIKGLTVCCFTVCCVCLSLCQHIALHCSAMQSNTKQYARVDRGKICIFYIQCGYLEMQN
ncbi:unnamed protein product, partial [Staurois parvus]